MKGRNWHLWLCWASVVVLCWLGSVNAITGGSYISDDQTWSASWVADEAGSKMINFTVVCRTPGWCALGIANSSSMAGTDVYWATLGSNCPNGCFSDRWATGQFTPRKDNHTDMYPISAGMVNGSFTFSFWRYIETGDLAQDVPITSAGNWLNWAYSGTTGSPTGNNDYTFPFHGPNHGGTFINLLENISPSASRSISPSSSPSRSIGSTPSVSPSSSPPPIATNSSFSYTNSDGSWSVSWELDDANITYTVTCATTGWCALGLNPNNEQMPGTDVYWASLDSNQCSRGCFSNRFAYDFSQPVQQSKQIMTPISAEIVNGVFTWKFSRPLRPSGQQQRQSSSGGSSTGAHYDLSPDQSLYLLWAFSGSTGSPVISNGQITDYSFGQHSRRGAATIDFFTGAASDVSNSIENHRRTHSILMYVCWLFLVPFAVFLSRYMKLIMGAPWFRLHIFVNTFAVLTSFAAFGIIVYYTQKVIEYDTKKQHFDGGHQALGLVLIIGTLIQPTLGVIADRLWKPSHNWKGLQDWPHVRLCH
eukprot:TRINITY_DN4243_c0_g1_i4.p1 TRINITY_DN4243_c0_g1~~TRINITY_DN4243_c0_g1_i4.p1  ORF type:complete len:533 (-),score=60.85 TRINITY_DN4243_c0_g1_i4:137-1735(-)